MSNLRVTRAWAGPSAFSARGAAAHSACATTTPGNGEGRSGASSFGFGAAPSGAACGPADSLATRAGGAGGIDIGFGARRSFSARSTFVTRSYTHCATWTRACTCSSTLAASAPASASATQDVSLMRKNWRWSMPMRGHGRVG